MISSHVEDLLYHTVAQTLIILALKSSNSLRCNFYRFFDFSNKLLESV